MNKSIHNENKNESTLNSTKIISPACLKKYISSIDDEKKFRFWVKALLSSINVFPEIIKSIDKIIEIQASTISFSSNVFNGGGSVESYVERMIDLSDRKLVLINIFNMTKKLVKNLSAEDYEFIERRFTKNWTAEELSEEYNISVRTVYRRVEKVIGIIYLSAKKRNWSLKFIESQVKNEDWLMQRYYKCVKEYLKNINYHNFENAENSLAM